MKKSVLFLLTFIMLLCVSISCFANQPYKHPDYNLRTVKEIHITKIKYFIKMVKLIFLTLDVNFGYWQNK